MINFPDNPKVGDSFTNAGTIYSCVLANPVVWNASPSAAPISDAPTDGKTYGRNNALWKVVDKIDVGLAHVNNTSDMDKPVSTAQQAALNLKENSIVAGTAAQYWRGDKTWQALTPQTVNAVAKTGDTMTGDLTIEKPGHTYLAMKSPSGAYESQILFYRSGQSSWRIGQDTSGQFSVTRWNPANSAYVDTPLYFNKDNGSANFGASLAAANGMGFRWDGSQGNYLAMGSSIGTTNWNWEWNRSTGNLRWMGGTSQTLFQVDGSGNGYLAGQFRSNDIIVNGGITCVGFYASSGTVRIDTGSESAFYAPNGGITVGSKMDAGGQIAGSQFYSKGAHGLNVAGFQDDGQGYGYGNLLQENPNWNMLYWRGWHQYGQWAGWQTWSSNGNTCQIVMSNGGGWGSMRAASFEVQSDERTKTAVETLAQQHSGFMAIAPISWKRDFNYKAANMPDLPDETPTGQLYDDPDRVHWGFSAQNLSGAVSAAVQGDVEGTDGDGDPITAFINPVPILAVTVLEVQALWNKIAELEAEIASLK